MENPRAVIGNNSQMTLDEAKSRLGMSGFMLARLETLCMAVRDQRIDRACLRVLVELIDSMNRETWTSWVSRETIAERAGMSAKSAGNYVYQLKALGYIVGERQPTPQANNRVLMHYTIAALSPEQIESEIGRFVDSIRGGTDTVTPMKLVEKVPAPTGNTKESARQDGQSVEKVPVRTGKNMPAGTGSACQNGQLQESACDDGQSSACNDGQKPESARQDGCSTIDTKKEDKEEEKKKEKQPRGTRLSPEWRLPKSWGEWALAECVITEQQVRREAKNFLDYWTALPGAKATKVNWQGTWRNWIRRTYPDREETISLHNTQKQRTEEEIKKAIESTGAVFEKGDPNALIG